MGLNSKGLGPADQTVVNTLGPEIIRILRKASSEVLSGNAACATWFGDSGDAWVAEVKTKLNRMASVLNTQTVDIQGSTLDRRAVGTFAAAQVPAGGWRDNTADSGGKGFMGRSHGQNFRIRLDIKWNKAPTYKTTAINDSKFQSMVHELTHLIINTEDEEYGYDACKTLATTSAARAKINADTWGYFVEEFR